MRLLLPGMALLAGIVMALFVPRVWQLRDGEVLVSRWSKKEGLRDLRIGPTESGWTPYQKVSLHLIHAVLVAEDDRFYKHRGLDFYEIWQSFVVNVKEKRFVRGASTITQQVVKLAFLSSDKTIIRKLREMLGAVLLECLMSKEEILAWYLNLIELGDGVSGVGEASRHYFQTEAELLTVVQSVHLAMILPGPNRLSKGLRRGRLTSFGHRRFGLILNKMLVAGYVTRLQWEQAMARGNFGSPVVDSPLPSKVTSGRPGRSRVNEPINASW